MDIIKFIRSNFLSYNELIRYITIYFLITTLLLLLSGNTVYSNNINIRFIIVLSLDLVIIFSIIWFVLKLPFEVYGGENKSEVLKEYKHDSIIAELYGKIELGERLIKEYDVR